jgi:hypothetical protein
MATRSPIERERLRARSGARVRELGPPHSGAVLEPPVQDEPRNADDEPVWRALVVLFPALALLVALEIATAFTVAYLVTGRAY